jgi:hypothetical protein
MPKKLIVIQTKAEGLGLLLKHGAEALFTSEDAGSNPPKKRRVILITSEGSTDPLEKTVSQVLDDTLLNEEEKPGKKDRHLKQLFKRALGSAADIVIVDNGFEQIVPEEMAREEAKTFEYETVQLVSITEYLPFEKKDQAVTKKKRLFSFLD